VEEKPLRILIADDQPLVRKAIRVLLESRAGWKVCAEAADGREAVAKTKEVNPDVVVMDLSMPNMNGLDATREIHSFCPQTQVLILTLYHFPELARAAQHAGAQGCVLKSDSNRLLIPAIANLGNFQPFFGV
jgi:DNA-binding NarL/FixJ family response regulator